jgi:hypothetical protein
MTYREVCQYVDSRGNGVLDWWLASLAPRLKAKARVRLELLSATKKLGYPLTGAVKGAKHAFIELRVELNNVQHRAIGFYGPRESEFTVLIVVQERDWKFPPGTTQRLDSRYAEVMADPAGRRRRYDPES